MPQNPSIAFNMNLSIERLKEKRDVRQISTEKTRIIISNPKALADAAALDAALASAGKLVGPLHGVPVLVKDNYDVAGLQTTGGSAALLGWVPEVDATVIAKIRAAGDYKN